MGEESVREGRVGRGLGEKRKEEGEPGAGGQEGKLGGVGGRWAGIRRGGRGLVWVLRASAHCPLA